MMPNTSVTLEQEHQPELQAVQPLLEEQQRTHGRTPSPSREGRDGEGCGRVPALLRSRHSYILHFFGVRVGVVLEDGADDAIGEASLVVLRDQPQVVVLHGIVVGVELERSAYRPEVGLAQRGAERVLVLDLLDAAHRCTMSKAAS